MARYFFHIHDGTSMVDDTGTELPDIATARAEAIRMAGEILRGGSIGELWRGVPWEMKVTDSPRPSGQPLFVLRFSASER